MALFGKEAEKDVKSEPQLKGQVSAVNLPAAAGTGQEKTAARLAGVGGAEARAYLDKGTKISGKLAFDAPARIDGQVDGEVVAKDSLIIGEGAVVTAQVKAASVIVAGKISGDVVATQRIEIRPSAKVMGNISTPVLVVHEGAAFEGHCAMQPEASREERKVTVFPKEERVAQAGGQRQA